MRIIGHEKAQLFRALTDLLQPTAKPDMVYVRPQIIKVDCAAPPRRGKRAYTQLKVEFGLDPTMFERPHTVHMLGPGSVMETTVGIPGHHFNAEGHESVAFRDDQMTKTLTKHPELGELLEEFLPKWRAVLQKLQEMEEAELQLKAHSVTRKGRI